jgi:hypothetical protein
VGLASNEQVKPLLEQASILGRQFIALERSLAKSEQETASK